MSAPTLAELLSQVEALSNQAHELDRTLSSFYRAKGQHGPLGEHLEDAFAGVLDAFHLVNEAKGVLRVVAGDVRKAQYVETLAQEVRNLGWSWGGWQEGKGWRAWRPGRLGTAEPVQLQVFGHSREQLVEAISSADAATGAEVASHG